MSILNDRLLPDEKKAFNGLVFWMNELPKSKESETSEKYSSVKDCTVIAKEYKDASCISCGSCSSGSCTSGCGDCASD
jgi:hypothetical protein